MENKILKKFEATDVTIEIINGVPMFELYSTGMALGYVKYNIPILFFVNLGYLGLLFFAIKNYGLSGVIVTFIIQAFVMVVIKELIMRKKKYKEFV